jgi:proteasome lid subunit RPN8/RPN11
VTAAVFLANALRERIAREARATFPRECCGLMEGEREGDAIRLIALHPARNLSSGNDRFEIDPADHFAAIHAARSNGHEIVGCYHSHPNGRAEPSARDGNGEDGFLWLIAAISGETVRITAFQRLGGGWRELEIASQPAENAA